MGHEIRMVLEWGLTCVLEFRAFFPPLFDLILIKQPHMDFVLVQV